MPRYVRAPGVVARPVAGELVLVSTAPVSAGGRAGEFYVLNESAELLWNHLESGASVDELERALVDVFDVPADQAAADVEQFVGALRDCGIVRESA